MDLALSKRFVRPLIFGTQRHNFFITTLHHEVRKHFSPQGDLLDANISSIYIDILC